MSFEERPALSEVDYRRSAVGRRRSWYGAKKYVKKLLSFGPFHWILRGLVAFVPRLRKSGRLPVPAGLREVEGVVQDRRFVMLRPDRCVIAKELYWGKGHRPKKEDDFALHLFASLARSSDVMIDVGAYTGIFTLAGIAVNPELHAHAFEIVPEVYRSLFDNCVRNDVLHRSTLHHEGIGDPATILRVPASSRESALPSFYSGRLHFESGTRVRFRSLDSLGGEIPTGSRVVMKIDVEGTEADIFRHGAGFIGSFRPDILCEVLEGVADGPELQRLLEPHGYHFYLVRGDGLEPKPGIVPDPRFRDWLFTLRSEDELRALNLLARR